MNFTTVVEKAREQLAGQLPGPELAAAIVGEDKIYGRVCTTLGSDPPLNLSSDTERKSVFVFGPDAIESIILKRSAYDILCSIGRDRDYLYHMVVENKSSFWLVLLTPGASCDPMRSDRETLPIDPATWDGIIQHVEIFFPEVFHDFKEHIHTFKEKTLEYFEEEAGFRFLDAKKNRNRNGQRSPGSPPYFSYKYYCSLPKPRNAWHVRAFLYCELRLHKLFTGDGYTCNEGKRGQRVREYLCPNLKISDLDISKSVVLPMTVKFPDVLTQCDYRTD